MKNVEFHFALEGISGKGKNFLLSTISEAKMFSNSKVLDSNKTNWLNLYKMINPNRKI